MIWTEDHVRALLQIASRGRVTPEERAHLPAHMQAMTEAEVLAGATTMERLQARSMLSIPDVALLLTVAPALASAGARAPTFSLDLFYTCQREVQAARRAGRTSGIARPVTPPRALRGHLCEQCLDAPAERLVPAPWGGETGVCGVCAVAPRGEGPRLLTCAAHTSPLAS